MISVYKRYRAVYWAVGIACILCSAVCTYYFPKYIIAVISLMAIIIFSTVMILMRATKNKFKNEVMSLLYDCRAQDYIEKVESLLGKRRSNNLRSTYSWLMALGYEVIGDFETMREHCMNITKKSHRSEYHRRMCIYYVEKNEIELANKEIESLKLLAEAAKGPEKTHLSFYIGECVRAVKIKTNDIEGLDQYFASSGMANNPVLLTRVSVAETSGCVLLRLGKTEEARKQLEFASKYGGDTKFKRYADTLLGTIN